LASEICEIFFGRGGDEGFWRFCGGLLGHGGGSVWFFGGVVVVECVVNVAFWQRQFRG
jgi:hypothetical protein